MITREDMIEAKDDRRHSPGPQREWNESYWFAFYDPEQKIGMMTRIGLLVNKKQANLWFFLVQNNQVVYNGTNLDLPLPDGNIDNLRVGDLYYQCTEPLRNFHLTYAKDDFGMDLGWKSFMPVFDYSKGEKLPDTIAASHIEQSGEVSGTITIKGKKIEVHGYGHRDHSHGERDWTSMKSHYWVEGQFGKDFAFNALRIFLKDGNERTGGFVYDGNKMMGLRKIDISVETAEEGRSQKSAQLKIMDDEGRDHEISGQVITICPVDLGQTNCDDAFAQFKMGDKVGYGIIELSWQH